MEKLQFRHCTLTKLDRAFGLHRVFTSSVLDAWLDSQLNINEQEKSVLRALRVLLNFNVDGWNEQELSMQFIGPVLSLVSFSEPYRFNFFAQRHIATVINEIELSGEPDSIIATGYREPEVPMFAFTEYKRAIDPDGDPAGQTLAAMLTGQTLNGYTHPVYGCYVIGSDWRFMLLENKHYAISRDYSALSDEVYDILRILKGLKEIVRQLTAEPQL